MANPYLRELAAGVSEYTFAGELQFWSIFFFIFDGKENGVTHR